MARPNKLHDFASYNTLFTLSGIGQNQLDSKSFLTDKLINIIARSGGIGQDATTGGTVDVLGNVSPAVQEASSARQLEEQINNPEYAEGIRIVGRKHDIFFFFVNILSVPSHNNERNLVDFIKMEFELVEKTYDDKFVKVSDPD